MHNYLKIASAVLLLFAVLTISACGKMSSPTVIDGSGYPHEYPHE